jgi:hypothetical protein
VPPTDRIAYLGMPEDCCAAAFQSGLCLLGVKTRTPHLGSHVRFHQVQTLVGRAIRCRASGAGSRQAGAEHVQQGAEFLPLCNRGLGPLTVAVLPIPLARRAACTLAPPCNFLGWWWRRQQIV